MMGHQTGEAITRRELLGYAPGALLAVASAMKAAEAQGENPPNIVLILADDLGYGDIGPYGQQQIKTPNLDRMAKEGTRFTQFYSGSAVCAPSRCALLTGLHSGHGHVRGNGGGAAATFRPEDTTIGELLKGAGYRTACFGKWGMGDMGSTGVPTLKGFDEFYGFLGHGQAHNYYPTFLHRGNKPGNEHKEPLPNVVPDEGKAGQGVATVRKVYAPNRITEETLAFIDRQKGSKAPFFLYYTPTLPHANNEAKQKGMEVPDYGAYADKDWPEPQKGLAAMITRLDSYVGQVFERLKANGLDDNTLVLFTSDNGPHREGGNNPDFFRSHGDLRGIKRDLYEGGIRVPLIARWPGKIAAGATSTTIGYFPDFVPTLTEIARTKPAKPGDGVSFAPVLRGASAASSETRSLYWEFYERGGARAVRQGNWKAVQKPWPGGAKADNLELYDLTADLGETKNIAESHPDIVARLRAVLEKEHTPDPAWEVKGTANASA
jgi:arylsulfatase A-like enzyme